MNAKIACLNCGYPSVLTCSSCIQDDHEREDCLPGLWLSFCSYHCLFYSDGHGCKDRLPELLLSFCSYFFLLYSGRS